MKCETLLEEPGELLLTCETVWFETALKLGALPLSPTKPSVLTRPCGMGAELTISSGISLSQSSFKL